MYGSRQNIEELNRLKAYLKDYMNVINSFTSNTQTKRVQGLSAYMQNVILKTLEEETKKAESEWINELKPKLSSPLPKKYKHKKRPQGRMFPYRIPKSNDIVSSIATDFVSDYSNGVIHIKAWAEIKSLHGLLTNYGFTRKGKGTSQGQWAKQHWMEKVLHSDTPYGNSKYGYVISFASLLRNIFRSKRLYNRIYYLKKKLKKELEIE